MTPLFLLLICVAVEWKEQWLFSFSSPHPQWEYIFLLVVVFGNRALPGMEEKVCRIAILKNIKGFQKKKKRASKTMF